MKTQFVDLDLIAPLQDAVRLQGYVEPTPIQAQAIPPLLDGRDLIGCARTGTGKTAAFALPILQRLAKAPAPKPNHPSVLVLVPTRELASQVGESFETYGNKLQVSVAVIFGGVGQAPQVRALRSGIDVLVATPGRLLDLMGQRHVKLSEVGVLVLDEADHMLDLGFIPDVRRILSAMPRHRQTLLFSATMPPPIAKLAESILVNPVKVVVTPPASPAERVQQLVHFVEPGSKLDLLERVLSGPEIERALVFTRTKRGADKVAKRLSKSGIPAVAIHGNKSQGQRERSLEGFREGKTPILVATDIAARGLDIDGVSHVVNFELPNIPESYVHRIGRTARAGASGIAISFCSPEEKPYLKDIEKLTGHRLQSVGSRAEPVRANARVQERHAHPPARNRRFRAARARSR